MAKDNSNETKWRGRIIRYAPLVLWVVVIFTASSSAGASQNTSMFIGPLLKFLFPDASPETLAAFHGYIRKLAHFTAYGTLAFFAFRAYANSSVNLLRSRWPVCAFATVTLIAAADEFNQSFNALRSGSIYDVMIDCAGGATVILVFLWSSAYGVPRLRGSSDGPPKLER